MLENNNLAAILCHLCLRSTTSQREPPMFCSPNTFSLLPVQTERSQLQLAYSKRN